MQPQPPRPLDNAWKNNFDNSAALYSYFTKNNLLAAIRGSELIRPSLANGDIVDADIRGVLDTIVQELDFGNLAHVPHTPADGTSGNTYPNASMTTPLKAFRLATNSPGTKRRVVITAGMHAREVAPPKATARYFSKMIINYVIDTLLNSRVGEGLPIEHAGFDYQAGRNHVFAGDGHDITGASVRNHNDRIADRKIDHTIRVNAHSFTGGNRLLDNLEIIVFPTCNPAGLDFVLTPAQESVDDATMRINWRKNRSAIGGDSVPVINGGGIASGRGDIEDDGGAVTGQHFAIGVDINRNADICWYYHLYYNREYLSKKKHGCSRNPYNFSNYVGANPNSELEVRAVLSAMMSSVANMTGTFPASLAPLLTSPGPLVSLDTDGIPVPPGHDNDSGASPDLGYAVAGRPACEYTGYLFCLDLHAYKRLIMTPWGMDTLSSRGENPGRTLPTYLNPDFDRARDGVWHLKRNQVGKMNIESLKHPEENLILTQTLTARGDTYQEFFPTTLTFANDPQANKPLPRQHHLAHAHMDGFGYGIQHAIQHAVSDGIKAEDKHRLERRSTYRVAQATDLYTVTGSPMDYAFSLNVSSINGFGTMPEPLPNYLVNEAAIANPARTGPVISLAIEVGHEEDGEFFPFDTAPITPRGQTGYVPYDDKLVGAYAKVERETFAAIHTFLQKSLDY